MRAFWSLHGALQEPVFRLRLRYYLESYLFFYCLFILLSSTLPGHVMMEEEGGAHSLLVFALIVQA